MDAYVLEETPHPLNADVSVVDLQQVATVSAGITGGNIGKGGWGGGGGGGEGGRG